MSPSSSGNGDPRTIAVRLPQELDYRLRGLGAEPTDQVPVTSVQTDQPQHRRGPLLVKGAIFVAVAALAAVLLQSFVLQPYAVPGNAMSPALQGGDRGPPRRPCPQRRDPRLPPSAVLALYRRRRPRW
jgi:hypothetical protein